jgi:hypothetical protein
MKRKGGVVNGMNFNAQLTVNPSVFRRLQSLINQSSGFCGTASGAASEATYAPVVRGAARRQRKRRPN